MAPSQWDAGKVRTSGRGLRPPGMTDVYRFIMGALLAEDIKGSSTEATVNAVPVAFCTLDT